jgi:hypothetical protein
MIMSMDLAGKTRQRPRQGSLLRPRPIGRDRVVFSRGQACRCCAWACVGRGAYEFARPLDRPLRSRCMRNLFFGKLHALPGVAIGGFGVQVGRTLRNRWRTTKRTPSYPQTGEAGGAFLHEAIGCVSVGFAQDPSVGLASKATAAHHQICVVWSGMTGRALLHNIALPPSVENGSSTSKRRVSR